MLDSNSSQSAFVGDSSNATASEEETELRTTKRGLVDGLIQQELRQRNKDVYEKVHLATDPPTGTPPSCIYFYYVRINNSGTVSVDHYFYDHGRPLPYADIIDPLGIVRTLALNARPRTRNKNPKRDGTSFKNVLWNKRSYVVMFFDERNWSFHRRRGNRSSIVFNVSEGQSPNESFFDATDLLIPMPKYRSPGTDNRSAIVLINHYLDPETGLEYADPDPKKPKQSAYKIDMYLQARYASSAPAMTVIFDPTGTNTSP